LKRRCVLVARQSVAPDRPCGQSQSRDHEPPQADPRKQKGAKPSIRPAGIGAGRSRMDCNGFADAAVPGGALSTRHILFGVKPGPHGAANRAASLSGSWRWVSDRQLAHCGHSWRTRFLQPTQKTRPSVQPREARVPSGARPRSIAPPAKSRSIRRIRTQRKRKPTSNARSKSPALNRRAPGSFARQQV
jgi:hypothetical protein